MKSTTPTFEQSRETARFLKVYNELISAKTVKNQAEFAKAMDEAPQSFSQILNGKRNITVQFISKLFTKYLVSPIYIHSGRGEWKFSGNSDMLLAEPETTYSNKDLDIMRAENKGLHETLKYLKENKETLEKYVKILEEQIANQKMQLQESGKVKNTDG